MVWGKAGYLSESRRLFQPKVTPERESRPLLVLRGKGASPSTSRPATVTVRLLVNLTIERWSECLIHTSPSSPQLVWQNSFCPNSRVVSEQKFLVTKVRKVSETSSVCSEFTQLIARGYYINFTHCKRHFLILLRYDTFSNFECFNNCPYILSSILAIRKRGVFSSKQLYSSNATDE